MIVKIRFRIVRIVIIMTLFMDFGHSRMSRFVAGLLFLVVPIEILFDFFTKHGVYVLWKINRTIVPGFAGYTFVVLGFTMRCPRYQGFNLGIPSEVGSMDVVEVITRCIYPIWCKDVINIIILFFLDT